jgi:hypothetical protein
MSYKYLAYGIQIRSEIELPAFVPASEECDHGSIHVSLGKAREKLVMEPLESGSFFAINEREFLLAVPAVARYYVQNGERVIIDPECEDWENILLFFYSNCMAVALFQRNLVPFHVSGVFIDKDRVLLFAAPSRTGKSTTAVMLQQKGYAAFTDDTAVLTVENGKCYAQASYPMIRLWQNTIEQQTFLDDSDKQILRRDIEFEKYGFMFHDRFVTDRVEVAGIVFLEEQGSDISIGQIKPVLAMQLLGNNVYRNQWLNGMRKQVLQFYTLTGIANHLPAWKAARPEGESTFFRFADAIEKQIIHGIL